MKAAEPKASGYVPRGTLTQHHKMGLSGMEALKVLLIPFQARRAELVRMLAIFLLLQTRCSALEPLQKLHGHPCKDTCPPTASKRSQLSAVNFSCSDMASNI